MFRFVKNVVIATISTIDHILFLMALLLSFSGLLFALPWVLKQRKIWQETVCGNQKALILLPIALEKLMHRGHEHLLPLKNPSMKWIGLLDSTNIQTTNTKIADDLYVITWRSPRGVKFLKKAGACD